MANDWQLCHIQVPRRDLQALDALASPNGYIGRSEYIRALIKREIERCGRPKSSAKVHPENRFGERSK